jgi:hypothetical protein
MQGVARRLHRSKVAMVMFKLDIMKAFDTVDWPFLIQVLRKLGFGDRWLGMIGGILSTASTRVLVNGFAGGLIINIRGLRQGDPPSPLLFDTVMEVLHLMFTRVEALGLLSSLGPRDIRHHTSMYADDVVTFLRPSLPDLLSCAAILEDFGVASRLRTNLAKCTLHPIRCTEAQVELACEVLGCVVAPFPCRYLGLPLGLRKPTATQL